MGKRTFDDIEMQPTSELTERRYVYNGDGQRPSSEFTPRGNRPVKRRKRSPSLIIGSLVVISMLIVLYIWNKITVNRLAVELNDLQIQYEKVLNANEILRAEINKKSSLERIGKIATGQLNLLSPKEQPIWFEIDEDRLAHIQQ